MYKLWNQFGGTGDIKAIIENVFLNIDKAMLFEFDNNSKHIIYEDQSTTLLKDFPGSSPAHIFNLLVIFGLLEKRGKKYILTELGNEFRQIACSNSEFKCKELKQLLIDGIRKPSTYIVKSISKRIITDENFSQAENIISLILDNPGIEKNKIFNNMTNVLFYETEEYKKYYYDLLKNEPKKSSEKIKTRIGEKTGCYILTALKKSGLVDEKNNKYKINDDVLEYLQNMSLDKNCHMPVQLIVEGIPGSGKSYYVENKILGQINSKFYKRVVFYDGYDYSEFIGGFRPSYQNGNVSMEYVKGPFLELLSCALQDKNNQYYLVIEEINRGNAPLIFGDFFQLLDRNKDPESKHFGCSSYSIHNKDVIDSLSLDENEFEEGIRLPNNFHIIGTMNTSDQNTFPLDTAFKRRFATKYFLNNWDDISEDILFFGMEWKYCCTIINNFIVNKLQLPEDKQMGPYFVGKNDCIEEKVINYLYDDIAQANNCKDLMFCAGATKDDIFTKIRQYVSTGEGSKFDLAGIFSQDLVNLINNNETK